MLLQYYSALQSTTPVLLCPRIGTTQDCSTSSLCYKVLLQYYFCPTKYYSSTTLYYKYHSSTTRYNKVLFHFFSVLQSTPPVLQYKYHPTKVPFQSYSVLQSTSPVLLCTTSTKHYSTTLYYKVLLQYQHYKVLLQYHSVLLCVVLLQYHSLLQSTTPVLLCTTKYFSSTTRYNSVPLCCKVLLSSGTLYRKAPLQHHPVQQSTSPVPLRTAKLPVKKYPIFSTIVWCAVRDLNPWP